MHYFSVGLLCLLLLFYLAQTIILPARRISVHLCFIICTLIVALGTSVSLSDTIKGLATPILLHLNQQIKSRRFIRYCFFLLLWFLALICSYIGLVTFAHIHFQLYILQVCHIHCQLENLLLQGECTPDQQIAIHFTPFNPQNPRCDYGQVH